ncbi:multidrug effflux MFS transporter [Vibrio sp. ZSDZ34]|jgi:DHA1 family bicyclomycin/chloramphenicol resistance-like MFS transporter|uniref:Bcr/CflA family efflux transporter n=1 Tax=Vibrio gelatinilyticus TaxID=2893468 RepID=A0A9X1WIR1_9VIBR|nr:multidrug effflux MFS transporter [Vibrio gelatinilyticus]MCJ2378945.1 multidrug effflux MFS transporter [Vibrio gelatinilyticus]
MQSHFNPPSRWQLLALVALVLFSPLAIDIYLPALPQMANSFGVSDVLAQDTITWFLFAMGVGQIFAGPLADKLGRRTVALAGITIYGLSACLAWAAQSIEWMLMARLLQGLGACATSVAAFATVRDIFGPQRSGKMISYLNGAICFIPALAPILGSWLTSQFGWRSNFSFMAAFALVIGAVVMLNLKETNQTPTNTQVFKLSRYGEVLKSPIFVFHATLCMLAMAVILGYVTSAPVILMGEMSLSMSAFTYWFAINAVFNIIACLIAPKIMDKVGTRKTIIMGISILLSAGALMLILAPLKSAASFMLPIILCSVGFAFVLGASAGKALAPFGDKAGTASALLGLFQMSGAGLIIGTVQRLHLDTTTMMALLMWLLLPGLLVLLSKTAKHWHEVTC